MVTVVETGRERLADEGVEDAIRPGEAAEGSLGSGAGSCAGEDPGTAPAGCNGQGGCGSGSGCGGHEAVIPELDARTIHPMIRQSAIFGVLVGLPPQAAVTIVAPNDPGPIVALLEERLPGEYAVMTDQAAADEWRVTFIRRAA